MLVSNLIIFEVYAFKIQHAVAIILPCT